MELVIFGVFFALVGIAALAHARHRGLAALGLGLLGLLALGSVLLTLGLLWQALFGPRMSAGLGNLPLLFMAFPAGLFALFVGFFLKAAIDYQRGDHRYPLGPAQIGQMFRFLVGLQNPARRPRDKEPPA